MTKQGNQLFACCFCCLNIMTPVKLFLVSQLDLVFLVPSSACLCCVMQVKDHS